jgi:hypothetical protein
MPHPFFDARVYPWHREDAAAFHKALFLAISEPDMIDLYYHRSGENLRPLTRRQAADLAWKEVLDLLTAARRLRVLCEILLQEDLAAAHDAVHAVQNAANLQQDALLKLQQDALLHLLQEQLLANDIVFVDRKRLRTELLKLGSPIPTHGVLLVRGPSGSGKSWTSTFVIDVARKLGAKSAYLYEGFVSDVQDVIRELFTLLRHPEEIPPQHQSDVAWYGKVCKRLRELAQQEGVVSWVIVDDLGEDARGVSRLDPEIRSFFETFGLMMGNPAFAEWFRLVLLDYPDRGVPTKWRDFWVEDRPNDTEVDAGTISAFLLHWAARKEKQLGGDMAAKFASDIIDKVNAPADPAKSRLRRINDELKLILDTL